MERRKPGVDVILDVLRAACAAQPDSGFLQSLFQQYTDRGFLTKKQLEGLHAKASKNAAAPEGKLATLQAIIQKMPNRYKSEVPVSAPIHEKNIPVGVVIARILAKYPEHKRVLFFKARYDTHTPLQPAEISELERFYKLLIADKAKP